MSTALLLLQKNGGPNFLNAFRQLSFELEAVKFSSPVDHGACQRIFSARLQCIQWIAHGLCNCNHFPPRGFALLVHSAQDTPCLRHTRRVHRVFIATDRVLDKGGGEVPTQKKMCPYTQSKMCPTQNEVCPTPQRNLPLPVPVPQNKMCPYPRTKCALAPG